MVPGGLNVKYSVSVWLPTFLSIFISASLFSTSLWAQGNQLAEVTHLNEIKDPSKEPALIIELRDNSSAESYKINEIWRMVERLVSRFAVSEFLKHEFKEYLERQAEFNIKLITKDASGDSVANKGFPDHLLFKFLQNHPEVWPQIERYLEKTVPILEKKEARVQERRTKIAKAIEKKFKLKNYATSNFKKKALEKIKDEELKKDLTHLEGILRNGHEIAKVKNALRRLSESAPQMTEQLSQLFSDLEKIEVPLRERSKAMGRVFHEMAADILSPDAHAESKLNVLMPLRVVGDAKGTPSVFKITTLANHPVLFNGKLYPAGNLLQDWLDFYAQAEKGDVLTFLFFEEDLVKMAKGQVAASRRGASVQGSLDINMVLHGIFSKTKRADIFKILELYGKESRRLKQDDRFFEIILRNARALTKKLDNNPDLTKAEVKKLKKEFGDWMKEIEINRTYPGKNAFFVRLTNPTSLMHIKFGQLIKRAEGLAITKNSSGNPTRSGIHPAGDDPRAGAISKPNSNHTQTHFEKANKEGSFPMADTLAYEARKIIKYAYRGTGQPSLKQMTFPANSSYMFEIKGGNYSFYSVSPGGGFGNVGENLLAMLYKLAKPGPIRQAHFVKASAESTEGLLVNLSTQLDQALEDVKSGKIQAKNFNLDIIIIVEKSFAMAPYSEALKIVGLQRPNHIDIKNNPKLKNKFSSIPKEQNHFKILMTDPKYRELANGQLWAQLRNSVFVAPQKHFGTFSSRNGSDVITRKLHHKLDVVVGVFSTLGKSLNDSFGGNKNNEMTPITVHSSVSRYAGGIVDFLASQLTEKDRVVAVAAATNRRNRKRVGEYSDFKVPRIDRVLKKRLETGAKVRCEGAVRGI